MVIRNYMQDTILIYKISVNDTIKIFFEGAVVQYAWLENQNKYLPDVIELSVDNKEKCINLSSDNLLFISKRIKSNNILKLSLSNDVHRISYKASDSLINSPPINAVGLKILINKLEIDFFIEKTGDLDFFCFQNAKIKKINYENKPLNIFVLGSCFSRNIFTSSEYFNPEYKKYFNISHTAFHNSIISLLSNPVKYFDYSNIEDLIAKDVFKYIKIEFEKNLFEIIDDSLIDFFIFDNYIDSCYPLVQISDNSFLTYNKYFAESIFKRNFSKHQIIYHGTIEHQNLYRFYVKKLANELKKRNLEQKVILIGGRLCNFFTNSQSNEKGIWISKTSWIKESNKKWDIIDKIFLDEIPTAQYIDMRSTNWISDLNCPIKGGASPSHYQSGFYKELYEKIKAIIFEK